MKIELVSYERISNRYIDTISIVVPDLWITALRDNIQDFDNGHTADEVAKHISEGLR